MIEAREKCRAAFEAIKCRPYVIEAGIRRANVRDHIDEAICNPIRMASMQNANERMSGALIAA